MMKFNLQAFIDAMNLGPINLRGMMDQCSQAQTQVERSLRLTLLGLAAKVCFDSSALAPYALP